MILGSRMLHFFVVLIFSRSLCCWYAGQAGEEAGCRPVQFAHSVREQGAGG